MFLSQKAEKATEKDKYIANDLLDTLKANRDRCVGLAANMIGYNKAIFCSNCWDSKQQLIQAQIDENGHYECPSCKVFGYYDKEKYDRIKSNESPIYVI